MTTHPAFEKSIDNNPLEATNHLVYADWLDEQGQHDEAAFRRSMGEWISRQPQEGKYPFSREYPRSRTDQPAAPKFKMNWKASSHNLPDGINSEDIATYNNLPSRTHWVFRSDGTGYWPRDPAHAAFDWEDYTGGVNNFHWEKYRHMEEGLRRAFMANRAANPERQSRKFSRIVRARRGVK